MVFAAVSRVQLVDPSDAFGGRLLKSLKNRKCTECREPVALNEHNWYYDPKAGRVMHDGPCRQRFIERRNRHVRKP